MGLPALVMSAAPTGYFWHSDRDMSAAPTGYLGLWPIFLPIINNKIFIITENYRRESELWNSTFRLKS